MELGHSGPVAAPVARRWRVPGAAAVVLAALLAYANSFPGAFLPDDELIVLRNPLVTRIDLGAILTTDYWGRSVNSGLHRPLTTLSLGLNRLLFGETPLSFHAVNVLLHALVALALLLLLRVWGVPEGRALLAAALFAVHPIHAEAVNAVVGRSELLAALFFLLALRWSQSPRPRAAWLAGLAYLAALLSKEHAVTFLAAVPLADAFFRRGLRGRVRFYFGLAAVTAAWLLLRRYGVHHGTVPPDAFDPTYTPLAFLPAVTRVLTALKLQLIYLRHLAVPVGLQGVYAGPGSLAPVEGVATPWGLAVLAAVAGYLFLAARWRRRISGLALLLYAVCFAATANLLFVTVVGMADRLAYLPAAWFCLFVAVLAPSGAPGPARRLRLAAAGALLLLLVGGTWLRNREFADPVRLWSADVARDPDDPLARLFLAKALELRGSLPEAERAYRGLEEVAPDFGEGLTNHAALLLELDRPREALTRALRAARAGPTPPLLEVLVEACLRLGRPGEALDWLRRAPERYRSFGLFWELQGRALEQAGDAAGARQARERAAALGDPGRGPGGAR